MTTEDSFATYSYNTFDKKDDIVIPETEDFNTEEVLEVVKEEPEIKKAVLKETTLKKAGSDVVLYSIKERSVKGLGKLEKGYTKVSSKDAEKWLEYGSVRMAKQTEIDTYFTK